MSFGGGEGGGGERSLKGDARGGRDFWGFGPGGRFLGIWPREGEITEGQNPYDNFILQLQSVLLLQVFNQYRQLAEDTRIGKSWEGRHCRGIDCLTARWMKASGNLIYGFQKKILWN